MTTAADNDNAADLSAVAEFESDSWHQENWSQLSDGNTALAPIPEIAREVQTTPPPLPEQLPAVRSPIIGAPVSEALSLDDLGLRLPDRATPAQRTPSPRRSTTDQTGRSLDNPIERDDRRQRHDASQNDGAGSPVRPDLSAQAQALNAAAIAPARKSVTGQPGFLFGLIAATVVGAGLYLQLL